MYKLIILILLGFNSFLSVAANEIVKKQGTVFYYGDQFFFFEFETTGSFDIIIDSLKYNKGVKLLALDLSSYLNVIEGMQCVELSQSNNDTIISKWDIIYYMPAVVEYTYTVPNYQAQDSTEVNGSFGYLGNTIPFVIMNLHIIDAKIGVNLGATPCEKCIKCFSNEIAEFPPGTFKN